jgi:flagellar hook assembly protein FlgD
MIAAPGPNPASFETRVRVELAAADAGVAATMRVYDLAGRLVRRVETPPLAAGVHQVSWNLTDEHGSRVPAGVYLVRVAAGTRQSVHRLVVVR